jgi:hypothetical protein
LKLTASAAAAALLAACQTEPPTELPDAYPDHPAAGQNISPAITPSPLVPPPVPPAQTEFGPILPRAAWTTTPLELRRGIPMESVDKITVHHSGDKKAFKPKDAEEVIRHLQAVLRAHLNRGMQDIGYHFAVDPVGRAWQLRSLLFQGEHVRPSKDGTRHNPHNIGIVMLGDFDLQPVALPQRDRLFDLIRRLKTKYNPRATIYMHRELVETSCPGKYLVPAITQARSTGQI